MTERPILFSGPLVQATLAGRKSETRRLVTSQTSECGSAKWADLDFGSALAANNDTGVPLFVPDKARRDDPSDDRVHRVWPRAEVGDRLWARETWSTTPGLDDYKPRELPTSAPLLYHADNFTAWGAEPKWGKVRPSIHMPRWAARIFLRVTDVSAERLQDITEAGAIAEGMHPSGDLWDPSGSREPVKQFARLWDEINGKREGASWGANPWVWVIEFEVRP